jgi:hypothetical protein
LRFELALQLDVGLLQIPYLLGAPLAPATADSTSGAELRSPLREMMRKQAALPTPAV